MVFWIVLAIICNVYGFIFQAQVGEIKKRKGYAPSEKSNTEKAIIKLKNFIFCSIPYLNILMLVSMLFATEKSILKTYSDEWTKAETE